MNTDYARKKVLKGMPIWDEYQIFRAQVDDLKFQVDRHLDDIRNFTTKLDTLSAISCTRRVKDPDNRKRDSDIIKLYTNDDKGNCVIVRKEDVTNQGGRIYRDANAGDSLDILASKPRPDEPAFVMLKPGEPWKRCKIRSVFHTSVNNRPHTVVKVNIVINGENRVVSVKKYAFARAQNHGDRLRTSKRVIAGLTDSRMRPGIIAQDPCKFNGFRYLVFLDDGNARYYKPHQVYPICYQSIIPWTDYRFLIGHDIPALDAELTYYFKRFPRRHLIDASKGHRFQIFRDGMNVIAEVVKVDTDVLDILFEDGKEESIYAGSARILQRNHLISMVTRDDIDTDKLYYKLIGHMQHYHGAGVKALDEQYLKWFENFNEKISICGNTARKSTARKSSPARLKVKLDDQRVPDDRVTCPTLQELIDKSDKDHKKCTPDCLDIPGKRTEAHVPNIEEEFRAISDIKVPLLLGWKRILVRTKDYKNRNKKAYVYEAPCGRIMSSFLQIRCYIRQTQITELDVDFFTFDREVILNRPDHEFEVYYLEKNIACDPQGKPLERKLISLINPFSEERLPLDFEYKNTTFPHPMLKAKGFSFNTEFKSGCDCEDDCNTRAACACHKLNELAAGTNAHNKGSINPLCQYKDKRLSSQVSTGIFECNEYCNCSSKCPNRVVQNGIRARLQVRKTVSKGWGVFALDDIAKGSFVCTYAAELLDDADQYGNDDMYFADLDYISVVEEGKLALEEEDRSDEGLASDDSSVHSVSFAVPEEPATKKRGRSRSQSPERASDNPELVAFLPTEVENPRYPRRNRAVGPGPSAQSRIRKPKPVFKPIFELLNETHDTYTLDARMQGNIGRFFNHSCDPNTFVQNVFIDTHDLRFPVVAFFSKNHIKADDEITWNYNYKIDSIAGRQIICNCSAPNCKGRIL